jgi:perosamine synthetase
MTNIQAAIGIAQLEKLDETIDRKREIGLKYSELLKECTILQLPLKQTSYSKNIYWVYPIVLKDSSPLKALEVMNALKEKGIGTRPFFYPMHKQPVFNKMGFFEKDSHPNSERIAERGFYIPSGVGISEEQVHQVAISLLEVVCK